MNNDEKPEPRFAMVPDFKPSVPKPRLSTLGFIHFQPPNSQPKTIRFDLDREVESDEVPYHRPAMKIGERWTDLDFGYLKDAGVGLLRLYVLGPTFQVIPTPEEKIAAYQGIVEVGLWIGGGFSRFAQVRPGESSFEIEPCAGSRYGLRCIKGESKVTIYAYPK